MNVRDHIYVDGTWVEPFNPRDSQDLNDFAEASSWIYSWFVPHDVPGLIELLGGPEIFRTKLDEYFAGGYHDASNQPGFHVPYLYNYAGAPAHPAHPRSTDVQYLRVALAEAYQQFLDLLELERITGRRDLVIAPQHRGMPRDELN